MDKNTDTVEQLPGLTPKGKPMPQSMEEWRHLAGLYANSLIQLKEEAGQLKHEINTLKQRISSWKRAYQSKRSL